MKLATLNRRVDSLLKQYRPGKTGRRFIENNGKLTEDCDPETPITMDAIEAWKAEDRDRVAVIRRII